MREPAGAIVQIPGRLVARPNGVRTSPGAGSWVCYLTLAGGVLAGPVWYVEAATTEEALERALESCPYGVTRA